MALLPYLMDCSWKKYKCLSNNVELWKDIFWRACINIFTVQAVLSQTFFLASVLLRCMAPCTPESFPCVEAYRRFEGTFCIVIKSRREELIAFYCEDGVNSFLRNVDTYVPNYLVLRFLRTKLQIVSYVPNYAMLKTPKYQTAWCYTVTYKIIQCNDTYEPNCTVLHICVPNYTMSRYLRTKLHGVRYQEKW
jgi:hypothetical protein